MSGLQRGAQLGMVGAALLAALACGGPFLIFPGGELRGKVVSEPVTDWSFADDRFLELETRPSDPYSVQINYRVRGGQLFVDPAEGRRWLDHLRQDPQARVRFGERIYPVTAVLAGRPGELPDFPPDRFVYRLESRAD